MMNKGELKNAIIDMNLLKLISDKELIMIKTRIDKHFLYCPPEHETSKVGNNEQTKEFCECITYEIYKLDGKWHCAKCDLDWYN